MPRLLVIARSFWPLASESSCRLGDFTRALGESGISVTVLTPRWQPRWPIETQHGVVRVCRIAPAPSSNWNALQYVRRTWRWYQKHSDQFDAVYVDCPSLLPRGWWTGLPQGLRLWVRWESGGDDGDATTDLGGGDIRWLVSDVAGERSAMAAGIGRSQIRRFPRALWDDQLLKPIDRVSEQRQARERLRDLSNDFGVPPATPLVVAFFADRDVKLETRWLDHLASTILHRHNVRVWVFGSNQTLRRYYTMLKDYAVHQDCLLHGSFDRPHHLLLAADAFVYPAADVTSYFHLIAAAVGCHHIRTTSVAAAQPAGWRQPLVADGRGGCTLFDEFEDWLATFPTPAAKLAGQQITQLREQREEAIAAWHQLLNE